MGSVASNVSTQSEDGRLAVVALIRHLICNQDALGGPVTGTNVTLPGRRVGPVTRHVPAPPTPTLPTTRLENLSDYQKAADNYHAPREGLSCRPD